MGREFQLCFIWLCMLCIAVPLAVSGTTINVHDFGAKANGQSDDSQAFHDAWKAACNASGTVKLWVPSGTYLVGPLQLYGPCPNTQSLTVQLEGTLKATTDLSKYKESWVEFGWVSNLILTGGGTFDGQGEVSWPYNKCPKQKECKVLPTSIKFVATNNTKVNGIKSLNSKFFHMALLNCVKFRGTDITITAPKMSPNTDGIHIEHCTDVTIAHATIGTGDDCISIGQGNSQVELNNINCGPGHGISVGSLGRYHNEGDVQGLIVRDSTITGTDNGVRIKTWQNSPGVSSATNLTFDNIVMNNVLNPILIDQTYCPYSSCDQSAPSKVKLSDIKFKNIRGTSQSLVAVTLDCSSGYPCQNVELKDINLHYVGGTTATEVVADVEKVAVATASCTNIKPSYSGVQFPPPCQ